MPYGFNEDKSKAEFPTYAGVLAQGVDIGGYYSPIGSGTHRIYEIPSDGYINVTNGSSANVLIALYGAGTGYSPVMTYTVAAGASSVVNVVGGMRYTSSAALSTGSAMFYALS